MPLGVQPTDSYPLLALLSPQGLNMPCGGPWNITGKCGLGLVCDKDWADFNSDGICVNASTLALAPERAMNDAATPSWRRWRR